ncbi:ECF RNA polymerase sigma factor SigK [Dyadobacter sp. CECT 9623]|uniref:ECF RNA polymerase sigma factor SigK n=1 Tax=Dyadobacter linearis TaxID=2823330 RepID=A0ABN7RJP8_9BACT|nr:sigma factor [Dyadobacter sp. CECT 9623]CAG5074800.1 ECF RNA polymerase sigma factor SigK [Dyadobacter sp. CECT 9623]
MQKDFKYTEQQLVLALKANQRAAFEYFYDKYSPGLYGSICQIIPDQEIASEILQEAFIEFWQDIRYYDVNKGTIFTWALSISRRKAMDRIRSIA